MILEQNGVEATIIAAATESHTGRPNADIWQASEGKSLYGSSSPGDVQGEPAANSLKSYT